MNKYTHFVQFVCKKTKKQWQTKTSIIIFISSNAQIHVRASNQFDMMKVGAGCQSYYKSYNNKTVIWAQRSWKHCQTVVTYVHIGLVSVHITECCAVSFIVMHNSIMPLNVLTGSRLKKFRTPVIFSNNSNKSGPILITFGRENRQWMVSLQLYNWFLRLIKQGTSLDCFYGKISNHL